MGDVTKLGSYQRHKSGGEDTSPPPVVIRQMRQRFYQCR